MSQTNQSPANDLTNEELSTTRGGISEQENMVRIKALFSVRPKKPVFHSLDELSAWHTSLIK